MALCEQTAARLVGFDELGAQMQISTLTAIEADLRRALSADVPRVRQFRVWVSDRERTGGQTREAEKDRLRARASRPGEVALGRCADD